MELYQGDTRKVNVVIRESDGSPIDITGSTLYFTVAKNYTANPVIEIIQNTHESPLLGQTNFFIESSNTEPVSPGAYKYDIRVSLLSGEIYTIEEGLFILKNNIKRL